MEIRQIVDNLTKQKVTRRILEALPDWFGIPEAREEYITESNDRIFFCAIENDKPVGFLYLKETGRDTVELYAMGVLKERALVGNCLTEPSKRQVNRAIPLFRLKQFKWESMRNTTGQTGFISLLDFKNLKYFLPYGMNGTLARYIL